MEGTNENDELIKFSQIVDQIVDKNILLKLHKNNITIVDGRILYFSSFIKSLCCNTKDFNCRLNLENVERDILTLIIQFITIVEWNSEKYMFEIKSDELNTWYENNKLHLPKIKETATYLKIHHIFDYFKYREDSKSI